MIEAPPEQVSIVKGACPHDCPDTCALEVHVRNGVAFKVSGAAGHPPTAGVLCTKVARYTERTYHTDRLLYPQRRVGRKGEGRFERISWDTAIRTVAERLKALAAQNAEQILPYSYAGTMGLVQGESMSMRFFHKLGASLLDRTICASAGSAGHRVTLGARVGMDMEVADQAKLILFWGSNAITSSVHFWARAQQAKRRGATLVAIDPYRSLTAEKCQLHVAPLPGTDAALALGMMHVLIRDGLIDHDYVERHTLGFERLAERAAQYPPRRVADSVMAFVPSGPLPIPYFSALSTRLAIAWPINSRLPWTNRFWSISPSKTMPRLSATGS